MDLFDYMKETTLENESPLASRMRPTTLEEVVGQEHIVGKDKLLYRAIKADKLTSVIFYGPPGTGKTTLAKVIAHTTSANFTQINATVAGKKDMEQVVQEAQNNLGMYGRKTILFIDEINCVSETLAPTMLQFLQCKMFGNQSVPEGWIIVAAGNPPEYNKSVREFDVVTLDRIKRIDVEADFDVWKEYAYQVGIHPAVLSYLELRNNCFYQMETTIDGKQFATPRGWEDLSELIWIYEKQGRKMDRELVGEYLQFPKIAKDFANYLELYYKYQDDYQVEQVLAGHISEAAVDKLQRASFDERISVVSLLLSGLNEKFRNLIYMEEMMSLRMEQMKKLQSAGFLEEIRAKQNAEIGKRGVEAAEQSRDGVLANALAALAGQFRADWTNRLENALLSRAQLRTCRAVSAKLEEDSMALLKSGITDWDEGFALLRERFGVDSDRYEELFDEAGAALEHAFDFMEAAFANSQELVLFVTELNTGAYSVHFLQDYECERYYQYNRNLLFSQEEQEIEALLNKRG